MVILESPLSRPLGRHPSISRSGFASPERRPKIGARTKEPQCLPPAHLDRRCGLKLLDRKRKFVRSYALAVLGGAVLVVLALLAVNLA